ncbi:pilus assembly protein [Undibacterium sp. RuTC16W]|uniref:pilus assembly protein n=1 Tax=Undibacterium sp. RuTC16W TaxID=3413048 RepID=UPI003BF0899B
MTKFSKKALCTVLVASHLSVFAAPKPVVLATTPLYTGGGSVHPNLVLDLSVEFPTVKAAYTNSNDYDKSVEYVGYFNPLKCYTNGGTKTFKDKNNNAINRVVSTSDLTNGYFAITQDADTTTHECPGVNSFSGNFMNWASSSSIDMLRLSLTGGDRIVDTTLQTILQRAYLYPGIYNSGNFTKKVVTASATMSAPSAVTPYNVTTLYILNCDNKIFFSDVSASGGCTTKRTYPNNTWSTDTQLDTSTDRVLGEFLVRVQVCDAAENLTRTDLCVKYPNGNFKPVGQMQRNPNTVRYGAFGYLMDNDQKRYGGVLRAPLKYVGAKQYKAADAFVESANDRPEWDTNSGVYFTNPENDASGNSGVINYLNKFGRTGTNGTYKTYDPVGELYYESIRYLQGRSVTTDATTGMTTAMKENFQVIDKWSDPIEASCQKNYVIVIGDANTWNDKYIPGNNRTDAYDTTRPADVADATWPDFNVVDQTNKVAVMESTSGYGNSAPVSGLSNIASADTGASGATFYMAGVAYWANTNNIRKDKPVRVKTYTIDVDEGGNGTMDASPRSVKPRKSAYYLAAKYGGFNDLNSDSNPFITFDADGKTTIKNNKEWSGTTTGNDPSNYFLASNPKKMMAAIDKIFAAIATGGGTLSGVGISSTSASDNPFVYEPGFNAEKWTGSLLKKSATSSTSSAIWDAGIILTGDAGKNIPPTKPANRKIYTSKVDANGSLSTVEFTYTLSNFSASNLLALNTNPHTTVVDNLANDRINYLRGERSLEQVKDAQTGNVTGIFRSRNGVLGDIVNSAPLYYGAPAQNISEVGYTAFYNNYASRQKAVYVGSNDGMLHAFNAVDGSELFGFIPNALLPKINQLTDPYYVHQAFVDGKMTVRDAYANGSWKTILASGMGAGAKGIFALDVTDPANFSSNGGAIWEFSDANDNDMGYVLNPPIIAKFQTGTNTNGQPIYGNFVIVSSGYNNYDSNVNATGDGALFVLSLDKKPGDPWALNSNYFKYKTAITTPTERNGLGTPTAITGGDGAVKYVYAGDLQGNLWRFDFSLGKITSAISPKSIFTAKIGSAPPQPITTQPRAIYAPGGGYIIYFGTGKYLELEDTDPTKYQVNSYYAILDTTYNVVPDRSVLEPRTATASGNGFVISGNSFVYGVTAGTKMGWYLDFYNSNVTGERSVTTSAIAGNNLFFNSLILSTDPCTGGTGRKYQLDTVTGLSDGVTGTLSTIGLMTSPIVININTSKSDRNAVGTRKVTTKISVRTAGTGGSDGSSDNSAAPDATSRAGRISWRELQNWQELRKEANK